MKQIDKEGISLLLKHNILRNSGNGFINKKGSAIGFYRTRNKRYIEDKYADLARRLT